ncbi:polyprenyl diphosphate synthase [Alteriqipengyuania lutimaris]|uniref:Isoprenyl transferase n=1 Tax=Alteriqipengyuania lutimaris TaxID=1538146 RepID=A0A395LMM8_9SPHN|nr:polyprenyl diphosphate synthase [Alteriqipengyuania lutimaris]MBB3032567.1 undecaprenyl diphosphate synthase [Alteriqipengyuania lutimaris]RDS78306.1 di-trans,poly-cis-decaprenylcistransferase [Alteriqipengyuania lutimaris]
MSKDQPPRHVAIIMDGNGRWAKRRGLPRAMGHKRGVEAVRTLVRSLKGSGIECVTLYAFSSENWKRPEDEVSDLMNLMRNFIRTDLEEFVANGVKLKIVGDWRALDPDIVVMLEDALERTANGTHTVAVALNYGSQQEIAAAARAAAEQGEITPQAIERNLFTADLPPVDLLIRTSGEVRLSNFLLWQMAYAEMMFVDTLWPDFTPQHLQEAIGDFAKRERRYGGR